MQFKFWIVINIYLKSHYIKAVHLLLILVDTKILTLIFALTFPPHLTCGDEIAKRRVVLSDTVKDYK